MNAGSSEVLSRDPVSVATPMNSHYQTTVPGVSHCGALCDDSAIYRPPEVSEDLSCCSPLNLAGQRPRDPASPSPAALQPPVHHLTELSVGGYPGTAIGSGSLGPAQLQPNHHHRQPGQPPTARTDRPSLNADWQLPPCATIRPAEHPGPAQPVPLSLAPVSSPAPHQRTAHPLLIHHPEQPQPAAASPSLASWPFRCSTCDRGFHTKEALRMHIEEHSVDKLCICDICGIRLSKKSSLRRHRMAHLDIKEFPCDVCRRSFYQRHDMLRHKAQHSKVALHCAGCTRQFSTRHHLAAHKCLGVAAAGGGRRRPAGGDRLACRLCSQTCSTPAAWGFHMWRHTKDAKYLPDFTGGVAPPAGPPDTGTEPQQRQDVRPGSVVTQP